MALANVRTLAARLDRIEQELRGPQIGVALTYSDADPVPEGADIVIAVRLDGSEPAGATIGTKAVPRHLPPDPDALAGFLAARGL